MASIKSDNQSRQNDEHIAQRDNEEHSKMVAGVIETDATKNQPSDVVIMTETHKAPDGGWAWFILLSALLMRIITSGLIRSNGLFYVRYLERFGRGAAETAWVTSLNTTCNMLMSPFVNILCNRITAKKLSFFGATLFVSSILISGFSTSLIYMYFSYGVLGGIGRAFMAAPTTILLGYYFDKRRSMAFGLAAAGMGLGGVTISPAIGPLFDEYGFTGAFIFLGGLAMNTFVCVLLMRPIDAQTRPTHVRKSTERKDTFASCEHMTDEDSNLYVSEISSTGSVHLKKQSSHSIDANCLSKNFPEKHIDHNDTHKKRSSVISKTLASIKSFFMGDSTKRKLFSFSVFKDIRFVTMVLAQFLNVLPAIGLFLPSLAKDRGITDMQTGYLISIMAFVDTVTRVACGFLLDLKPLRKKRPYIYNMSAFIQCLVFFTFPTATTFSGFAGLCCVHGFASGMKMAQRNVILVDILGVDKLTSSNAIIQGITGIGTLVGPPISGTLKDVYGKYDYTFYFGGSAALLGALILAGGNIRNYCTEKSKVTDGEAEDMTITVSVAGQDGTEDELEKMLKDKLEDQEADNEASGKRLERRADLSVSDDKS